MEWAQWGQPDGVASIFSGKLSLGALLKREWISVDFVPCVAWSEQFGSNRLPVRVSVATTGTMKLSHVASAGISGSRIAG